MRRSLPLTLLLALLLMPGVAQAAAAPKLTRVRCVPVTTPSCSSGVRLEVGRKIQLTGKGLTRKMRVTFRWSKGALATKLEKDKTGWTVRIPAGTTVGTVSVSVTDRRGRRSNPLRITILAPARSTTPLARPEGGLPSVFTGPAMWIWNLDRSDGGDLEAIATRARLAGMQAVFVKAAEGATLWRQFSPELVQGLKAQGLRVCGWQYVRGADPEGEAKAAAAAIAVGADCFIVDAEKEYEGRYAPAATYMAALRAAVGAAYPIGFTSFPYVDYHPRMPYSVFLGPGGAQANLPQAYWKDIGNTVDAVSAKTIATNRVYGRPLAPIGQTYQSPDPNELRRFRAVWAAYGAAGHSWWSWEATPATLWPVLAEPTVPTVVTDPGWPGLGKGSTGDLVVALQQRLATFDTSVTVDGDLGPGTATALAAFQAARGLPATGETDAATWQALLRLDLAPVTWRRSGGAAHRLRR